MTWDVDALKVQGASHEDAGNVVGFIGNKAQWGSRVYRFSVPATKASSFGAAGRTHLVAQRWQGRWRARTLAVREVKAMFEDERVQLSLHPDKQVAMASLGNAGPAKMVLPFADVIVKFCAPPSSFVPTSADQIVSPDAVGVFRGAMDLTHRDFMQRAKLH